MRDACLEVQHLTKHFPLHNDVLSRLTGKTRTLQAVDDIRFCIQLGETLGLVGESGCGKSTTARLLTRLIEPSSGTILLKGENLFAMPSSRLRAMRKTIQLVFQDLYSSLNPRKTVAQFIAVNWLRVFGNAEASRMGPGVGQQRHTRSGAVRKMVRLRGRVGGGNARDRRVFWPVRS